FPHAVVFLLVHRFLFNSSSLHDYRTSLRLSIIFHKSVVSYSTCLSYIEIDVTTVLKYFIFYLLSIEMYPPVFVSKPEPMTLYVGKQAVFQCSLTGSSPMDVVWHKDNIAITSQGNCVMKCEKNKYSLQIKNLELSDQGLYLCKASNSVGTATFTTELNVICKPSFIRTIQPVSTLGESGTLTCGIIGRPLPDIKWYRFGKELIQSRKYKMSSDGRNHSLTIVTDEQEDEGLYTCRAVNEAGEIETSGKLRLQAAPQFHPGFPLKEKYNVGAGTSLRLHVVYIGQSQTSTGPDGRLSDLHAVHPLQNLRYPSNPEGDLWEILARNGCLWTTTCRGRGKRRRK
uniref:Ig-like domain-containing protein n=1 Tax=Cynoglossus semilaevis TaxID=244447 RepID=A0A3P8WYL4_CYNSE